MGCCESYQRKIDSIDTENMKNFDLKGFKCRGKVVKVIDGDTFDILLEIKSLYLENKIYTKKHFKFYGIFRTRLYGIDCAEKNTLLGKEIKSILEEFFLNKPFVECDCLGKDKYGRLLVDIFTNGEKLSWKILNMPKKYGVSYNGGNKDNAWKNH